MMVLPILAHTDPLLRRLAVCAHWLRGYSRLGLCCSLKNFDYCVGHLQPLRMTSASSHAPFLRCGEAVVAHTDSKGSPRHIKAHVLFCLVCRCEILHNSVGVYRPF